MSIAPRALAFVCAAAALPFTAGCPAREVSKVEPDPSKEQGKEIPLNINRDVDILFVIDDSGSMGLEQDSLTANFNRFINVLQTIEGGLPNVHIGVVSTDMGTGPFGACNAGTNDNGHLLNGDGGCDVAGQFIQDITEPDGSRTTNYSGDLSDAFSCIASLGTDGCGFEQQLESMRAALEPGANPGFLRDDAYLAVIFITDEDDCSVNDPALFRGDRNTSDPELGPLTSFRCFEFGVECEPDDPRSPGPKQNCKPRDDSPYLYDVQEYVTFLEGLKEDPDLLIVAGIVGVPTPVRVTIGGEDNPDAPFLVPSCQSGAGDGFPAVRLASFLESFPERNTLTTICNEDLSKALILVANLLATVIGNPCIDGDLTDRDDDTPGIQPNCSVTDVVNINEEDEQQTVLPSCEQSSTLPCWQLVAEDRCSTTPTGLALQVCRGLSDDDSGCPAGEPVTPPDGTTIVVRCEAN